MIVYELLDSANQTFRELHRLAVEDDDGDLHLVGQQKALDLGQGDMQGLILWESVCACGNQREGNAFAAKAVCQGQSVFVAGAKRVPLSVSAVVP